jgi:FAD/FMN-containing dehydrogenase
VNVVHVLRERVRGEVLNDDASLERYSRDASPFRVRPRAVVVAAVDDDVAVTVEACRESGFPLTPRSGGTGLAGQSIGSGVILDLASLPVEIEVSGDGERVTASSAATVDAMNAALEPFGRRLGPDLTSSDRARLGGIVSTNACGATSHRFGRTADTLESVEAVLGTGERRVLDSGAPAEAGRGLARAASGYVGEALCGAEGTLGVVLSATLRTVPAEPAAVGVVAFEDVRAAVDAVPGILERRPHAIELMDRLALRARWPDDPAALLLVEMRAETEAEAEAAFWDLEVPGAIVSTGLDVSARTAAWGLRRSVLAELLPSDGRRPVALVEDACVPVERLGELVIAVEAMAARLEIEIVFYGHAAAGVLHLRPLLDLDRQDHRHAAVALVADHADRVLELGGTVSSEHGWGLARSWLVPRELPAETLNAWRRRKDELDPDGIMNPGRIFPDRETFPAEYLASST